MFTKKIRLIVYAGALGTVSLMNAGKDGVSPDIYPGGDADKCYQELRKGWEGTSEESYLFRTIADKFYWYSDMNKKGLMETLKIVDDTTNASIIKWILIHEKHCTPEEIQQSLNAIQPMNSVQSGSAVKSELSSDICPGSVAEKCYQELKKGWEGTSEESCLYRTIADKFYWYESMDKKDLMELFKDEDDTTHASIIKWILIHEKHCTPGELFASNAPVPLRGSQVPPTQPIGFVPVYGVPQSGNPAQVPIAAYPGVVPHSAPNPFVPTAPSPFGNPPVMPRQPVAMPQKPLPVPQPQMLPQQFPVKDPSVVSAEPSEKSPDVSPKGTPTIAASEESPVIAVKIDVVDKKTIQISFDDQVACKLTYDHGLWDIGTLKEETLDLLPLEPGAPYASFEFGGVNFKIYLSGDIEVFGNTPVQHCVLECPKEGKLIIPSGKDLQVNRFVCLTRGKTIENYGRLAITEACFCFEQKIVNHGDIVSTSTGPNKGAILLLQSTLTGGAVDVKVITLEDRSYPEYGCCCFYGFDRSLYPVCQYPKYSHPDVFADYDEGRRNFFYITSCRHIQIPFKGQTKEKDYIVPFCGDTVGIIVANGNHGGGNRPSASPRFRFCESLSGRTFAECTTTTRKGITGDSLNGMFRCKLPTRLKMYFFYSDSFMLFEGSEQYKYAIPAVYFLKL